MKRTKLPFAIIAFFSFVSLSSNQLSAQGIELTVGYPYRIAPKFPDAKRVNTLVNANVGLNFNMYVRSFFFQVGLGYQSNNYNIDYKPDTLLNSRSSARVKHNFIYIPFMAYTSFYEDNSRIISAGLGASVFVPLGSPNADIYYQDGSSKKGLSGKFNVNVCPRVAFRFIQYLRTNVYLHTELYTEIAIFKNFDEGNPAHFPQQKIPGYQSRATIGLQIGVQYVFPIKEKTPQFFEYIE